MTSGMTVFFVVWSLVLLWLAAHCFHDGACRAERMLGVALAIASTIVIPAFGVALYLLRGPTP